MPTPKLNITPTPIPRSIVRATVLADVMSSFGLPSNLVDTCQRGYLAGDLSGLTIYGYNRAGFIEDEVTLWFDQLQADDDMNLDANDSRSMVEKLSRKFAHAVSFSVNRMKARGLGLQYSFHHAPGRDTHSTNQKYGLTSRSSLTYQSGYQPRTLFTVRPGTDPGIHFTHRTAWKTR